ncbi:MAG TPA: response regulator, partial [Azospira sp.]|nr:response regulator [Azospira sp.]
WREWHKKFGGVWIALSDFGASTMPPELADVFTLRLSKPLSRKEFVRGIGQAFMATPRSRNKAAETPALSAAKPVAVSRPRFNGRILLVEDNLTNQEVTRGLLQVFGCQVDVACNGLEALEKWAGGDFDLILMDCQMPVMDGLEASRELRRREALSARLPTAIIALTANSFAEDRQRCLAAGMNGFLAKPFDEIALMALLTDWLGPPEGGGQVRAQIHALPERSTGSLLDGSVLDAIAARQEEAGEGRREFLTRFIGTFLSQAELALERITEGSAGEAREAAHSLKSAAASIGARLLSELASRVELAARLEDGEAVARLGEGLAELLGQTRRALEDYQADAVARSGQETV